MKTISARQKNFSLSFLQTHSWDCVEVFLPVFLPDTFWPHFFFYYLPDIFAWHLFFLPIIQIQILPDTFFNTPFPKSQIKNLAWKNLAWHLFESSLSIRFVPSSISLCFFICLPQMPSSRFIEGKGIILLISPC